jgi:hypothetical protein
MLNLNRKDLFLFITLLIIIVFSYLVFSESLTTILITVIATIIYVAVSLGAYLRLIPIFIDRKDKGSTLLSMHVVKSVDKGIVDSFLKNKLRRLVLERLSGLYDLYIDEIGDDIYKEEFIERYKVPKRLIELLKRDELSIEEYMEALEILERWL